MRWTTQESAIATPPRRIAIVTAGSAGDLFPFIRLGLDLRARGHAVTLLAPAIHAPLITGAGLGHAPIVFSEQDMAVLDHPDLWHPRKGFAIVWQATRPGMRQVPALAAALRPDVLVCHPLALPEADLCRAAAPGLRVVAAYLAPSNLLTVHDPLTIGPAGVPRWVPHAARRWLWRTVFRTLVDPVVLPDLNAQRRAAGLAPVAHFPAYLYGVADLSVTLFPAWFGPPQPDWPRPLAMGDFALYDPAAGDPAAGDPAAGAPAAAASAVGHPAVGAPAIVVPPIGATAAGVPAIGASAAGASGAALARFLADGPPPLVFTPGTGNRQAARYFAAALEATRRMRARAVFLTLHREQVPAALPPTVLWQDYAPLRALLPHAAVLVHHGGIGTTAEALRAGVPQLAAPLAHDQFDNAARVRALGAGAVLPAARVNAGRLERALRPLLAPAARARCADVATRFAGGTSLAAVCDAIETA